MNNSTISDTTRSLLEIIWFFGPKGENGDCCNNLSMPEFLALDKVATSGDCAVHEVGVFLNFTKSGATRIVNRLEKKGYVNKIKSTGDARICCVVITETGKDILEEAEKRYSNQLKKLLSGMSVNSEDQVFEIFHQMAAAIKD